MPTHITQRARRLAAGLACLDPETAQLVAALAYAARGWPVFPCKPQGKDPLTAHGLKDASTDPATIRTWWHKYPRANVAIVPPPGLVVIDIDAKAGGLEWLAGEGAALCPPTLTSETGGGGLHLLYSVPPDAPIRQSASAIAPGVDVRAAGKGYIVAPPSLHPSGTLYHWRPGAGPDDGAPAAAPWPLLVLLTGAPAPDPAPDPVPPPPVAVSTEAPRPAPGLLLRKAGERARTMGRNDNGFWLACQLRDNGYTEWEAESIMRDYQAQHATGDHAYTWTEARASLQQAYRRAPRAPWPVRPPRYAPAAPMAADPRTVAEAQAEILGTLPAEPTPAELQALVMDLAQQLAEERARADALQYWQDRALTLFLGNEALDTSDRVAIFTYLQLVDEQELPIGEPVDWSQKDWAARCHISPATMSRYADKWAAMGLAEHKVVQDTSAPLINPRTGKPRINPRTGQPIYQNRTQLACQVHPWEVEIAVLKSPPGKKKGMQHGGKRECPACGADGSEQEIFEARRCRKCQAVYESNGRIIAPGLAADSELHDATVESDPLQDATRNEPQRPPAGLPLRQLGDELRDRAPDDPRLRQHLNRVRAEQRRRNQDADVAEYRHRQATHLQDATREPAPALCPQCGPLVVCTCERSAVHVA
jgi:Bifunctional DNA primase/polymerase, N-terminal